MARLKAGEFYRLAVDRPAKTKDSTKDVTILKGTIVKLIRVYATSLIVMDKDNNWTSFQKGLWMSYLRGVSPAERLRFESDG